MRLQIPTVLAAAVVAVIAALVLPPAVAAAAPIYPVADPDPFYAAPPDLSAHPPGDVLKSRPMPSLPTFPDTTITLVQFRSTNSEVSRNKWVLRAFSCKR
jgi:hypothetical protein